MKALVTNIEYDTDGQKIKLPKVLKFDVPIDLDEDNLDIEQFLEDEGLTQELEDDLQDSSLNSSDDSDEYEINQNHYKLHN